MRRMGIALIALSLALIASSIALPVAATGTVSLGLGYAAFLSFKLKGS